MGVFFQFLMRTDLALVASAMPLSPARYQCAKSEALRIAEAADSQNRSCFCSAGANHAYFKQVKETLDGILGPSYDIRLRPQYGGLVTNFSLF